LNKIAVKNLQSVAAEGRVPFALPKALSLSVEVSPQAKSRSDFLFVGRLQNTSRNPVPFWSDNIDSAFRLQLAPIRHRRRAKAEAIDVQTDATLKVQKLYVMPPMSQLEWPSHLSTADLDFMGPAVANLWWYSSFGTESPEGCLKFALPIGGRNLLAEVKETAFDQVRLSEVNLDEASKRNLKFGFPQELLLEMPLNVHRASSRIEGEAILFNLSDVDVRWIVSEWPDEGHFYSSFFDLSLAENSVLLKKDFALPRDRKGEHFEVMLEKKSFVRLKFFYPLNHVPPGKIFGRPLTLCWRLNQPLAFEIPSPPHGSIFVL
jgi:hypothetical protein